MLPKVGLAFGNITKKIAPYERAIEEAGLEAIIITPEKDRDLDGLRGLVLAGGSDVDPALYGERIVGAENIDRERDELEVRLLREALSAELPVLAICRGMQLFNVVAGGSLIQHLDGQQGKTHRQPEQPAAHTISIKRGTKLAAILGENPMTVNSRHHQAAGRLGAGISVSATAPDGVIEAIEIPGKGFAVAVQWHPEDRTEISQADRNLFAAFAAAVR